MLRATLIVALALASGCILENRNTGSAAIYWTFSSDRLGEIGTVRDGSGAICAAAGVEEIRITLTTPAGDVLATDSGSCVTRNDVPGAAFAELELGRWGFYIAGYRGGVKVFDDSGSFEVFDGARAVVDTRLARLYWDVTVAYTTLGCAAGEKIGFDLYDSDTDVKVYSTADGTPNPAVTVPCVASGSFVIPSVPPGNYRFSDWIHFAADGTPYRYATCRPWWANGPASASLTIPTVTVTSATAPVAGSAGMCP